MSFSFSLFFFFLIGKKKYIQITARCKKSTSKIKVQKRKETKRKNKKALITEKKRAKEKRNRVTRSESPSPSPIKREPAKRASSWSSDLSKSSNVSQLRSLQMHHIKHSGTRFQMLDECYPNQFHHLNRQSCTIREGTQEIPKVLKTKHHCR